MMELLKTEFSEAKIESNYTECCDEPKPVSAEIEKITQAVSDLADMVSDDLVVNCKGMETALKERCAEIKKTKLMVRKLLSPPEVAT